MYWVYNKAHSGSEIRYTQVKLASLFGCTDGWIPWLLNKALEGNGTASEPLCWHISPTLIASEVAADTNKPAGNALVIDMKPNNPENLSLYEIHEIWGCSKDGWTPLMLHLKGLFIDAERGKNGVSAEEFVLPKTHFAQSVFSIHHVYDGTVAKGKATGKWPPPAPSSTNAALLWPEVLDYFAQVARQALR